MVVRKLNGAYCFEYTPNSKTDVQVIVTNYGSVTMLKFEDDNDYEVELSSEEKEEWLNKVEDMRKRHSKVLEHLNKIDELKDRIDELKEEVISFVDLEDEYDIYASIENGNTTEEISKILML